MTDTITISDTAAATDTTTDIQPLKKKHHRRRAGYAVTDEELLYEISDAGMLFALRGVMGAAGSRTYYFDRCPDVQSIIDKFNERSEVSA
ncbi:MAG: hypothetical protein RR954_07790 [Christensenellaceae bacterium]